MSLIPFVLKPAVAEVGLPTTPGAPSVVSATGDSLVVRWTPASDPSGIAGYRVWIGPTGGTLARVSSASLDTVDPTYTFTNLSAGTVYDIRVQGVDVYGNVGPLGAIGSNATAVSGDELKWNPGTYVRTNKQAYSEIQSERLAEITTVFNDVGSNIKGFAYAAPWGDCERTKGDYSAGDALIDAELARCQSHGYRLILQTKTRKFGGSTVPSYPQSNQRATPDYLIQEGGHVFVCSDGGGEGAALHQSYVMDRLLLWIAHLGARYDGNPWIEGFVFGETSYNMSADTANWSEANYVAQLNRLCDALRTYWPHTWCSVGINYFWGRSQTATYTTRNINAGNAMAVPDAITNDEIPVGSGWTSACSWGIDTLYGYTWNGSQYVLTLSDRHLEVPLCMEMQIINAVNDTPSKYQDHVRNNVDATHMVYTKYDAGNSYRSSPAAEWLGTSQAGADGLKHFLNNSVQPMRTAFPTKFTADGLVPITGGT